jgi:hypothetical protein
MFDIHAPDWLGVLLVIFDITCLLSIFVVLCFVFWATTWGHKRRDM